MTKLGVKVVSEALIRHIDRRAALLVDLIEAATEHADARALRDTGSQLGERIAELQENIHELKQSGSEDLMEAIEDFHQRLWLAQKKVDSWDIPAATRKAIEAKHKPKQRTKAAPTKSRRRKKAGRRAA